VLLQQRDLPPKIKPTFHKVAVNKKYGILKHFYKMFPDRGGSVNRLTNVTLICSFMMMMMMMAEDTFNKISVRSLIFEHCTVKTVGDIWIKLGT